MKEMGRFQVPFLRDPNTGAELYESAAIVAYLNGVPTGPITDIFHTTRARLHDGRLKRARTHC